MASPLDAPHHRTHLRTAYTDTGPRDTTAGQRHHPRPFPMGTPAVAENAGTCLERTAVGALLGGHRAVPRGTAGRRPMLVIPHAGLVVALEGDGDQFSSAPDAGLLEDVA